MIIETKTPQETFEVGKKIGENAKPGQIYTLTGDLGVGKTVFTQGVAALVCEYLAGLVGEPFPCGLRRQLDLPEPYVYFVGTVGFVCGFVGHFVGDAAQAEH